MTREPPGRCIRRGVGLGFVAILGVSIGGAQSAVSLRASHMVIDGAVRGGEILVATQSGRVEVFDWRSGRPMGSMLEVPPAGGDELAPPMRTVATSPSGRLVAAASSNNRLWLLELIGEAPPRMRFTLELSGVQLCRFLDEGSLLVGTIRGEVALIDLERRSERYRRQLEYDPVYALALGPGAKRLAVAFRSSRIHLVDPRTGETTQILKGHRDSVMGVAWLAPAHLVSGGKDKRVLLWEISERGASRRILYEGDRYVTAVAADPSHRRLAFVVDGERVGVLDAESGRLTHIFDGHTAPVQFLTFVDAGSRVISTGNDARILVWDLSVGMRGTEDP